VSLTESFAGSTHSRGARVRTGRGKRLDAAKELFRAAGGQLKAFYLVTGQYDAVAVAEVPNDEAVAKLALATAAAGNVRAETLRAFTEDEYRRIIASIS
jgi:uncharacterized protein with GYD domain